jgi:hypothetical protein
MRRLPPRTEGGYATLIVLILVVLCAALAAGLLTTTAAHDRESQTRAAREGALHMAESGLDWALAQLRERNGDLPNPPSETRPVGATGEFTVDYFAGEANGQDDDGDGDVDEADEDSYRLLRSTGRAAGSVRRIEALVRISVEVPPIEASVQINVGDPLLELDGNAFLISGDDHVLDGGPNPIGPSVPAVGSPAPSTVLSAQVAAQQADQLEGAGGPPAVGQVGMVDLDKLAEQGAAAATVILAPGTYTHEELGDPTVAGIEAVYCPGDLHLSAGTAGSGILVVDGDLTVSGAFTWTGIIVVRGRVDMTGGGSTKRVVGALLVGEAVSGSDSTSVGVAGTVDLLFSTEAIALAERRLGVLALVAWWETGVL